MNQSPYGFAGPWSPAEAGLSQTIGRLNGDPGEPARESSIGPMSSPRSSELLRGAVDALPDGRLAEQLERGAPLRVKFGVDPTSPDIHLGHCVVLTKLRAFQDAGHTVVLIIGDYTARVGDPSGRDATRPVLSADEIEANGHTYTEQAFSVLDRDRTEIRHNSEWLAMESEQLFGLVRRFNVARLLERDDFSRRIAEAQPISALELLYPVLQGYDSVAVEADVELGGHRPDLQPALRPRRADRLRPGTAVDPDDADSSSAPTACAR